MLEHSCWCIFCVELVWVLFWFRKGIQIHLKKNSKTWKIKRKGNFLSAWLLAQSACSLLLSPALCRPAQQPKPQRRPPGFLPLLLFLGRAEAQHAASCSRVAAARLLVPPTAGARTRLPL